MEPALCHAVLSAQFRSIYHVYTSYSLYKASPFGSVKSPAKRRHRPPTLIYLSASLSLSLSLSACLCVCVRDWTNWIYVRPAIH